MHRSVNLKDVLRKIQTNCDTLHGGRLPSVVAFTDDHVMAHRCRAGSGGRPPHQVNPNHVTKSVPLLCSSRVPPCL